MREKNRIAPDLIKREETKDYLKGIPNDWCTILKQQCTLCPTCKNSIRNQTHMETVHKIEIPSYTEIWSAIKETFDYETTKQKKKNKIIKVKRNVFLKIWRPILCNIKDEIGKQFEQAYKRTIQPHLLTRTG